VDFEIAELLEGRAMQTWIRIMQWVWALSIFWIFALLLRGGFTDLMEIARSPRSDKKTRTEALARIPVRFFALLFAALFGATSFAVPFWLQGAVLIVLWREASAALGAG